MQAVSSAIVERSPVIHCLLIAFMTDSQGKYMTFHKSAEDYLKDSTRRDKMSVFIWFFGYLSALLNSVGCEV
jgi:hypothetical protein